MRDAKDAPWQLLTEGDVVTLVLYWKRSRTDDRRDERLTIKEGGWDRRLRGRKSDGSVTRVASLKLRRRFHFRSALIPVPHTHIFCELLSR